MIDLQIIKMLEEYTDIAPKQLIEVLENKFQGECEGAKCFCLLAEKISRLYQDRNETEFPSAMHQRLMDRIREACRNPSTA